MNKITGFLWEQKWEHFGLKILCGAAGRVDPEMATLATTFYGVEALRLLGAIDSLDKSKTIPIKLSGRIVANKRKPGSKPQNIMRNSRHLNS